jgi:NTP pyrophosphatase (non-canonical NTP hydrolase)
MKTIDITKLNQLIDSFITERDWDKFHSLKNLAMALSVESSELLEIFQWMKEEESNNVSSDAKTLKQVEEELADIFYFLLRFSQKTGIDLEKALIEKMKKNAEKYPATQVYGSSKKYDQY